MKLVLGTEACRDLCYIAIQEYRESGMIGGDGGLYCFNLLLVKTYKNDDDYDDQLI